jgi:hypothetical protein
MSEIVIALGKLHAWTLVGIVIARVSVGRAFLLSGGGKLFVNERREQMRQTLRDARIAFPSSKPFCLAGRIRLWLPSCRPATPLCLLHAR